MDITRTSVLSGIERTLDIPITPDQYNEWKRGVVIQRAMPHLTADEREFIMSGITADEWTLLTDEEE